MAVVGCPNLRLGLGPLVRRATDEVHLVGEPSLAQVCGCREQVEHPFARGQEPDVEQSRRVVPGFRWAEIADHDAVLDEEQPAGRHRPRECVPRALRCGDHDVRGEQHEAGKPASAVST